MNSDSVAAEDVVEANVEIEKVKAKRSAKTTKYKKAPDAPKRFKSAFIIFSAEKHKEIKNRLLEEGKAVKTTNIAKLVSEAWKDLPKEERAQWEAKAERDKARYVAEKAIYKGPWKIPANMRTPKDPTAPKRPMSAFLAFSNSRRAALKKENPKATNADLSKMLSKAWKEVPMHVKKKYMDEESKLREKYKADMAGWREKEAIIKKAERDQREALALQAADAQEKLAADQDAIESQAALLGGSGIAALLQQQQQQQAAEGARAQAALMENQYLQAAAASSSLRNVSLPNPIVGLNSGTSPFMGNSMGNSMGNAMLTQAYMRSALSDSGLSPMIDQQRIANVPPHLLLGLSQRMQERAAAERVLEQVGRSNTSAGQSLFGSGLQGLGANLTGQNQGTQGFGGGGGLQDYEHIMSRQFGGGS